VDEPVLRAVFGHRVGGLGFDDGLEAGPGVLGLVGPSGAGKTTLLRVIAGLATPAAPRAGVMLGDRVLFDSARGVNVPPEGRRVGLMFQEGALFPHLTVAQNVAFGMRDGGPHGGRDRRRRVQETLERFGLAPLATRRPDALSGGERRRVALARALAAEPEALLLDEPFTGLDVETKARVTSEVARHVRDAGMPVVLVAHEFADVAGLASRVAVMEAGRIVQSAPPLELVAAPLTPFVAALAGVNFIRGVASRRGDLTHIRPREGGAVLVSTDAGSGEVAAVVSPWDVAVSVEPPGGSALNSVVGPVVHLTTVGNRVRVSVGSIPLVVAEVTEQSARRLGLAPGMRVVASWKATGTRLVRVGS
jgi:molybdate transport system ATP-binding protein